MSLLAGVCAEGLKKTGPSDDSFSWAKPGK